MADREPCWTSCANGAICHRGGIGCPRPHADDPPELRKREARGTLAYDPVVQEAAQAPPAFPLDRDQARQLLELGNAAGPAWQPRGLMADLEHFARDGDGDRD